jgi:hypothetical protein
MSQVKILSVTSKSVWNDTASNLAQFSHDTLHPWSRSTGPASHVDLQSIRLLLQLSLRVKSGGGQMVRNSNSDETGIEAIGRLCLSDLRTLDHSFLKKSTALLLDNLPLLEESVSRLVVLSFVHQSGRTLPHTAHASNPRESPAPCVPTRSQCRSYV